MPEYNVTLWGSVCAHAFVTVEADNVNEASDKALDLDDPEWEIDSYGPVENVEVGDVDELPEPTHAQQYNERKKAGEPLIPQVVVDSIMRRYPEHGKQMMEDMEWSSMNGCWMVKHPTADMWLGIETDGYIHS